MNNYDLIEKNELSVNANGGTELMLRRLYDGGIDRELLEQFQIIPSRATSLNENKFRILWCHDLINDPEADKALLNNGWRNFHKIVFVSNWQCHSFIKRYNIPWSKTIVIQNAIEPIEQHEKPKDTINLIYFSTPQRGLNILVAVFQELAKVHSNIILNVYSSFEIYGWKERDEHFKDLFEICNSHEKINYHGSVSNEEIREVLKQNHIFAYPSIWEETSCLALIEAMSAGLVCVHPNYGALYETAANWTSMYAMNENIQQHAGMFYNMLDATIRDLENPGMQSRIMGQKTYADVFYNWNHRRMQWEAFLKGVVAQNETKALPKEEFVYRA